MLLEGYASYYSTNVLSLSSTLRTPTWDSWRTIIGVGAVAMGLLILATALLGASAGADDQGAGRLLGEFACMGQIQLQINEDGTGRFDDQTFTWEERSASWLAVTGDTRLEKVNWNPASDGLLSITFNDGTTSLCYRR